MKKLLIGLLVFFSINVFAKKDVRSIEFTSDNYFAVTSVFNETLLESFTKKILTHDGEELLVYFDSPGGSVFAVSRMVGLMKSTDIKFICVARFAASAAFTMFQQCDKRYLLYDGIIMQHNASGLFWDEFPRVQTLFKAVNDVVEDLEKDTAKRMSMKYKDFKVAINNNLWLSRVTAPKYNAIDEVVEKIGCTKDAVKKIIKRPVRQCGWFSCKVTMKNFSACPLITAEVPSKDNKDKLYIEDLTNRGYLHRIYHIAPGYRLKDSEEFLRGLK